MGTVLLNVVGVLAVGGLHMGGTGITRGFDFKLSSQEYQIFIMWVYSSSILVLGVVTLVFDRLMRRAFAAAEHARSQTEAKNRDIKAILKGISAGIFTITDHEEIHEDYSDSLSNLIGESNLAGKPALETAFGTSSMSMDQFDQLKVAINSCLGDDELVFDANNHGLPAEVQLNLNEDAKTVEIDWDPIVDQKGQVEKVLVTMRDVTEQRALKKRADEQQEELDMMKELVEIDHDRFIHLYHAAVRFIEENQSLIAKNGSPDEEVVKLLFINMHTIKGDA